GAAATIALGERVQTQTVMPTRSYLSQVEPVLTFGFGPGDLDRPIERVEIAWPSGQRQTIERLEPRTTYTITEPDGWSTGRVIPGRSSPRTSLPRRGAAVRRHSRSNAASPRQRLPCRSPGEHAPSVPSR